MASNSIPKNVKEQVKRQVEAFNQEHFDGPYPRYVVRFRTRFAYFDRNDYSEHSSEICRLEYTGEMDKWDFAIYRHSRNRYDPDEWMFPGSGHVNGTVAGALLAGVEAYPIHNPPPTPGQLLRGLVGMIGGGRSQKPEQTSTKRTRAEIRKEKRKRRRDI